jgi:hypothetical protein
VDGVLDGGEFQAKRREIAARLSLEEKPRGSALFYRDREAVEGCGQGGGPTAGGDALLAAGYGMESTLWK